MPTPLLAHSSELVAAGFHALGSISSPEIITHYFVHPAGCRLAFVSEGRGWTRLRAYDAHPLEVLAVTMLCHEEDTMDRADALRLAESQLSGWGLLTHKD